MPTDNKNNKEEAKIKEETKPETKNSRPEIKEENKPSAVVDLNKPPLALVRDFEKIERIYSHADLEGIYRLKLGRRKGLDVWIVDGAKVRRELYTDFIYGGNDQRYKFIPFGEIWIDNAISVEELEFTIIHEIFERDLMLNQGMSYSKAHDLAAQEELKARINKVESIDELRERWYKLQDKLQQEKAQEKPQEKSQGSNHEKKD